MHIDMKGLFATAALSLLVSLVPMERSWAVPTLELGEAAKGETLVRGFFDGMDLKVTSHGTDPLPGLSLADYLASASSSRTPPAESSSATSCPTNSTRRRAKTPTGS